MTVIDETRVKQERDRLYALLVGQGNPPLSAYQAAEILVRDPTWWDIQDRLAATQAKIEAPRFVMPVARPMVLTRFASWLRRWWWRGPARWRG